MPGRDRLRRVLREIPPFFPGGCSAILTRETGVSRKGKRLSGASRESSQEKNRQEFGRNMTIIRLTNLMKGGNLVITSMGK